MVPVITYLFVQNYMEQCLQNKLEMQELIYVILCVLLMHMINNSHNILMAVSVVVVKQYHQI